MNFVVLALAALIPLAVGMVWYNSKVFGTIWMNEIGKTEEDLKGNNMLKVFGLVYLFSFFMAFAWQFIVIHQFGAMGMIGGDITKALPSYAAFMADYGTAFRTFKHGALHGGMSGLFLSLPFVGVSGLFEMRSWKYIFIHVGFWVISGILMGGVICQFA